MLLYIFAIRHAWNFASQRVVKLFNSLLEVIRGSYGMGRVVAYEGELVVAGLGGGGSMDAWLSGLVGRLLLGAWVGGWARG